MVASQKGGSGKSTLAVSLAVQAHLNNKLVALFDLDEQGSTTYWGDNRERFQDKLDPPVLTTNKENLVRELERVEKVGADLVILDTPPNAKDDVKAAIAIADLVLVPTRSSAVDLHAIGSTLKLVLKYKKPAIVVLNAIKSSSVQTRLEAEAYLQKLERLGIKLCPHPTYDRIAFSKSVGAGLTPEELDPTGKAAKEIRRLYKWVSKEMGL